MYIMSNCGRMIGYEKKMLFCSPQNEHFISSPCANFPDSQKADVFSQLIERMQSYVARGCSPLRQNNCVSPNFKAIYLFRNREEAGWFVLQNVPLLGLEQESTIPAQWAGTSTSLSLLGIRPPQQDLSCRPVSEASSVLQLLPITLSSPPEGTVQLVFLELFVVT